jgi:hypothetical protein
MKKAVINSLPKSGTNLLAKALDLVGYTQVGMLASPLVLQKTLGAEIRNFRWLAFPKEPGYLLGIDSPVMIKKKYIQKMITGVGDNSYLTGHLGYTADIKEDLLKSGYSAVLITRDPRAVLSSFVHFVRKEKKHHLHQMFNTLDEDACFKIALRGYSSEKLSLQPLRVRCDALSLWMRDERVLKIKFEDLIGAQGGGSLATQEACLHRLFDHLSIPHGKVDHVVKNLFGEGRHTFRQGRIDSWKEEIPSALNADINYELGDVIERWGYAL